MLNDLVFAPTVNSDLPLLLFCCSARLLNLMRLTSSNLGAVRSQLILNCADIRHRAIALRRSLASGRDSSSSRLLPRPLRLYARRQGLRARLLLAGVPVGGRRTLCSSATCRIAERRHGAGVSRPGSWNTRACKRTGPSTRSRFRELSNLRWRSSAAGDTAVRTSTEQW